MPFIVSTLPGPVRAVMLTMMRPVMRLMFPTLLSGIMPKVMSDMLAAVERQVPMPELLSFSSSPLCWHTN